MVVYDRNSDVKKAVYTMIGWGFTSSGAVNVKPQPGKCGKLKQKGTEIHEGVHSATTKSLLKQYGSFNLLTWSYKKTPQFYAVWNSADNWWKDEFNAYGSEKPFYDDVINELNGMCCGQTQGQTGSGNTP